jgi:hypothetical protein
MVAPGGSPGLRAKSRRRRRLRRVSFNDFVHGRRHTMRVSIDGPPIFLGAGCA